MTFKVIVEIGLIGLISFVIASFWMMLVISSLLQIWIHKWFREREEYIKRMLLSETEHEYEKHLN